MLRASQDALESFREDVEYLWCPSTIPVYEQPPSALEFLRNHVAKSRPCLIRNAIPHDNNNNGKTAPLSLTLDDLVEKHPNLRLHVDITPDGHGDCVRRVALSNQEPNGDSDNATQNVEEVFVKPMEREVSLASFAQHLRKGRKLAKAYGGSNDHEEFKNRVFPSADETANLENDNKSDDTATLDLDQCVLYFSRQNDCLRQELISLWNQHNNNSQNLVFPRSFPWAAQAFGVPQPDAVNLWIGDERAMSSMHKDHYENLFYVLSGEKVFGLCPPADAPFLYETEMKSARFARRSSSNGSSKGTDSWCVLLDHPPQDDHQCNDKRENAPPATVHWIAADVFDNSPDNLDRFPLLKYAHPIPNVKVRAGEMLYLPSLWFHHVTQSCETLGINYWYDMTFENPQWCYFHLLQQLKPDETKQKIPKKDQTTS